MKSHEDIAKMTIEGHADSSQGGDRIKINKSNKKINKKYVFIIKS